MIAGFEITVHHPHTYVVKCIQLVRGEYTIFVQYMDITLCIICTPRQRRLAMCQIKPSLQIQPSLLASCC